MSTEDAFPPPDDDGSNDAAPEQIELMLEEWCKRKSATDRRVEMLGSFYQYEKGRTQKATSSEFEARYAAFATMPA